MSRKIEYHAHYGFAGAECEDILEFEDNITDEEIEETVKDEVFDRVDWNWWER